MKNEDFLKVCKGSRGHLYLALDREGNLWRCDKQFEPLGIENQDMVVSTMDTSDATDTLSEWKLIDFNSTYVGYYPEIVFTALCSTDSDFVVAGVAADGLPYVFRSMSGDVWNMAELIGGSKIVGYSRAQGRINKILYDPAARQVFLLCDNGDLVTLPDCPKCVRIRHVSDQAIIDGELMDKIITLILRDGSTIRIPSGVIVQLRASYSYAKNRMQDGGYLVDLRESVQNDKLNADMTLDMNWLDTSDETNWISREEWAPRAYKRISMLVLPEWLEEIPKETFLAFLCSYGTQADEAADYARGRGFYQAFSLGGAKPLFHEE